MSSSALLSDDAPLDPDDELLVAYLDGELDTRAESLLMDRLVDEPDLNRRLQQLQDGWEWLDKLPDVTPNEGLVESTLELVVADIVKANPKAKPDTTKSSWDRYRWPLGIVAACLLAGLGTIAVDAAVKSIDYRRQLEDLALAENVDAYQHGQDLRLMRTLVANASWRQMITAMQEIGEFQPSSTSRIADTPIAEREQLIANMSVAEREQLAARWDKFTNLHPVDEQRIRETAAEVAVQDDAKTLLETMESYEEWRQTLPTELRDAMKSGDRKTQRQAIDEAIEITKSRTSRLSGDQLDDETLERIHFVLGQIIQDRIDGGDEATAKLISFLRDRLGEDHYLDWAILAVASSGRSRFQNWIRGPVQSRPDRPSPLQNNELEMIRSFLPDSAVEMLDVVSEGDSLEDTYVMRNLTLRTWAEETARRKALAFRERSSPLERYQQLSEGERERLDLMSPDFIIRRLLPSRGGPGSGSIGGPGGPGFGGPGGPGGSGRGGSGRGGPGRGGPGSDGPVRGGSIGRPK